MADRFPIILNTSANQLQEIASGDTLDVSGAAVKTNLVDSLSVVGIGVSIVGVVTATSFVGSGANLTNIDITAVKDSGGNVKIQAQDSGAIYTGIHTFGSTTSFTNGVFNGTVTSTGAVVNGDSDLNGDLDVDGHTNLDNVNVAGVTTFAGAIFAGAINGSSAAFTGDVSVAGTLTYEDVKNVDSVGVATARTGLKVLAGGANVVGVVTASNGIFLPDSQAIHLGNASGSGDLRLYHGGSHSYISDQGTGSLQILTDSLRVNNAANNQNMIAADEGAAVTLRYAGSDKLATSNTGVTITGAATATTFIGALTGTASGNTTISNNADNRVVTGGSGNALNGEANLTFNGNNLQFNTTANSHAVILKSTGNYYNKLSMDSNVTSANAFLNIIDFSWDGDKVADIVAVSGSDTTNKDDGQLVFRTSPSQGSITERIRITGGGNIVKGHNIVSTNFHDPQTTTDRTPNIQIHGGNSVAASAALVSWNSNAGSYYTNALFLAHSGSSTIGTNSIVSTSNTLGSIVFSGDDGDEFIKGAMISAHVDGTPGADDMPARLQFWTNGGSDAPSERARITSDGYFLLATTSQKNLGQGNTDTGIGLNPAGRLNASRDGAASILINRNNSAGPIQVFYLNGVQEGYINVTTSGITMVNTSDYRLKENETTISDGITKVKQLIPRRFNFKADKHTTVDGFFAHEVSPVVPESVFGEKDATIDEDGDGYLGNSPSVQDSLGLVISGFDGYLLPNDNDSSGVYDFKEYGISSVFITHPRSDSLVEYDTAFLHVNYSPLSSLIK